jgi:hypothetical protein
MACSQAVFLQEKLVFISVKPADMEELDMRKWFAFDSGMTNFFQ